VNISLQKLPDGNLELILTVPWSTVSESYEKVVTELANNTEFPGFRKGKAPRKLAEEHFSKDKIYQEVLKYLLPKVYQEAITEQKLHPIVNPKIELKEAAEGKDWLIRILTCEKPQIELGDYKAKIQEIKNAKRQKIWLPGQKPAVEGQENPAAAGQKPSLDEILKVLFTAVKITLPQILIENELNRSLSELIDGVRKLGLTVEQYLASSNRTADGLRGEYAEQAKSTLSLEFALEEIADQQTIQIDDKEIDQVIQKAKTEEEKKALAKQRYFLAYSLRRQKTLDFLANL